MTTELTLEILDEFIKRFKEGDLLLKCEERDHSLIEVFRFFEEQNIPVFVSYNIAQTRAKE